MRAVSMICSPHEQQRGGPRTATRKTVLPTRTSSPSRTSSPDSPEGMAGSSAVTGGAGLTLLARALTNLEVKRLVGVGAGRRAVVVQKSIHVGVPVEDVYDLCSRYEAFPSFMANVLEVQRTEPGKARWRMAGPLGVPITFETEETRRVPYELISWKTVDGSPMAHAGTIRFDPDGAGTRVHLQMSYNPPAGAIGHTSVSRNRVRW